MGLPEMLGQQRMRHLVFPHCKEMPGKSVPGDREEPSAFLTLPGEFRTLFHPKDRSARVSVRSHGTQEDSGCSIRSAQGTNGLGRSMELNIWPQLAAGLSPLRCGITLQIC